MTLHIHEATPATPQPSVAEAEVHALETTRTARESRLKSVSPKLASKFLAPAEFNPDMNQEEIVFYESLLQTLENKIAITQEELQKHKRAVMEKAEAMMLCSGVAEAIYTPSHEDSQCTERLMHTITQLEDEKVGYTSLLDDAKLRRIRYEEAREREEYGLEEY